MLNGDAYRMVALAMTAISFPCIFSPERGWSISSHLKYMYFSYQLLSTPTLLALGMHPH